MLDLGDKDRYAQRLLDQLSQTAVKLGLVGVGVSPVRRYLNVKTMLYDRKAEGLNDNMEFTYRNPIRSTDPRLILANAQSVVTSAFAYDDSNEIEKEHSSLFARYARSDSYQELRNRLELLSNVLHDQGHRTVIVIDSNALVDKEAALRSGLGIYLKNSLIAVRGIGSNIVLGNIVTDVLITRTRNDQRLTGCGTCTLCISACPTAAIGENGSIDARRCLSWVLQRPGTIMEEYRALMGTNIYGCDICQDVCPYNARRKAPNVLANEVIFDDLVYFLNASDEEILANFAHLYIRNRDVNILRRNALISLANFPYSVKAHAEAALDLIDTYCNSTDLVLVEHATWSRQIINDQLIMRQKTFG